MRQRINFTYIFDEAIRTFDTSNDIAYSVINIFVNHLMVAELDKIFEALASSPRRQILAYLSKVELSTRELAERFSMSAPAISRHLSILENAGLVASERRGQFVMYRLKADSVANSLTSYVFELCPVGRPLKKESRALAKRRKLT